MLHHPLNFLASCLKEENRIKENGEILMSVICTRCYECNDTGKSLPSRHHNNGYLHRLASESKIENYGLWARQNVVNGFISAIDEIELAKNSRGIESVLNDLFAIIKDKNQTPRFANYIAETLLRTKEINKVNHTILAIKKLYWDRHDIWVRHGPENLNMYRESGFYPQSVKYPSQNSFTVEGDFCFAVETGFLPVGGCFEHSEFAYRPNAIISKSRLFANGAKLFSPLKDHLMIHPAVPLNEWVFLLDKAPYKSEFLLKASGGCISKEFANWVIRLLDKIVCLVGALE